MRKHGRSVFFHIQVMDLNLWVRRTNLLTTPEAEMAPIPTSGKSIWQSMLRKCGKLRMSMLMLESMAIGIWKIPNPCCINGCKLTRSNPIINIQLWVLITTGEFLFSLPRDLGKIRNIHPWTLQLFSNEA